MHNIIIVIIESIGRVSARRTSSSRSIGRLVNNDRLSSTHIHITIAVHVVLKYTLLYYTISQSNQLYGLFRIVISTHYTQYYIRTLNSQYFVHPTRSQSFLGPSSCFLSGFPPRRLLRLRFSA